MARPSSALVDPFDRVFVDVLTGGGWETLMTFVNMSSAPAQFTLTFCDDNSNPAKVPLTNPDGSVSRFAAINFSLDGNTSQELVVANADNNVNYTWAYLSFPGNTAPIAGMAVVRTYGSSGTSSMKPQKRCPTFKILTSSLHTIICRALRRVSSC